MKIALVVLVFLSSNFKLFKCDTTTVKFQDDGKSGEVNKKWNSTWTDKLKKDLLLNYDKFSGPVDIGKKVLVYADLILRRIEIDEQRSVMTLHSWIQLMWNDEKLKWDPSEYGGLKELYVAEHEIWQPDIYPYNGVLGGEIDLFGNTNSLVQENGTITWFPPSTFQVFCVFDMTLWPFDKQICTLFLGSWTYSGNLIDIEFLTKDEELDQYLIQSSEWKFVKMERERFSSKYPYSLDPFMKIGYKITIQRQSPSYNALLITPATAIIIMALAVFLIPPTSSDKITLGGSAIMITCLFLLYFTHKLPVMAGTTPLIVLFYSRTLYFLSFSLVIAVFVMNLAKNPKFSPLPWSIKSVLAGKLGTCLLINDFVIQTAIKNLPNPAFKSEEISENIPVLPDQEKESDLRDYEVYQRDWILLAVAIDRIAFLIYCLIFATLAITYSV